MATTELQDTKQLPPAIAHALGRLDRRIRTLNVVRGIGRLLVLGSFFAILAMVIDVCWELPEAARWGIWLGWVAFSAMIVVLYIVQPLFRRLGRFELAALVEHTQTNLGERLTSAVGLLKAPHGSPTLIDATTAEAISSISVVSARRAFPARKSLTWISVGLLMIGLIALPAFFRHDTLGHVVQRFLMPWRVVDRVSRFAIDVPPDQIVAIGSELEVRAFVWDRLGRFETQEVGKELPLVANLEWSSGQGPQTIRMSSETEKPAVSREFLAILPAIDQPLKYRVRSGSVVSREVSVSVEPPPEVQEVMVRVISPDYMNESPRLVKNPQKLDLWDDSQVEVQLKVNALRPLKSATIYWPMGEPPSKPTELKVESASIENEHSIIAAESGPFWFELTDTLGLKNRPTKLSQVNVRKDAPPSIDLAKSDDLKEFKADDTLILSVAAQDDLGVKRVELHWLIERAGSVETDDEERGMTQVSLDGIGTRQVRGDVTFDLSKLNLKVNDIVHYQLRALDTRPKAQEAWTAARSLTISNKAEPLIARRDRARRAAIQAKLDELKRDAATNRQETEQLRYAADAAMRGSGSWDPKRQKALSDRETQAQSMVDRLNMFAHELDKDDNFAEVASPVRRLAELEAESGRAQLEKARKAENDPNRLSALRTADTRLAAVQARLDEIQRDFDAIARRDVDRDKLRLLAARQENIAERAKDFDPGDDNARAELQKEQDTAGRELDDLLRQSNELRADVVAAQAKEAEVLAKKARELAEHQRELARTTNKLETKKSELKALAEAQKQIEKDARLLALDVDPALMDSGKARLNVDALNRVVGPLERDEIDQARQSIEEAENSLRGFKRDLEDIPSDPKAQALRLAKKQNDLIRQIGETRREAAQDTREELLKRLKPLADQQASIGKQVANIKAPEPQKNDFEKAVKASTAALEALMEGQPQTIDSKPAEARQAIQHLANTLPDSSRRDQENRGFASRARQATDDAAREVERHLRETTPPPGKPMDPDQAAADLAKRLDNAVKRQKDALEQLGKIKPDARTESHIAQARDGMEALAKAIDLARQQAETLNASSEFTPLTQWRVVGTLPINSPAPFALNKTVDFKAPVFRKAEKPVLWRAVDADSEGLVELDRVYAKQSNVSAFAVTEIVVPVTGRSKLAVGSDDTLTVWINGRQVYKFGGSRTHLLRQDKVDVDLVAGTNQVVVQCGNLSSDWAFSVATTAPLSPKFDRDASLALRAALPQIRTEAQAVAERLEQKMNGQNPTDELVKELAKEQKSLTETKSNPIDRQEEQRRIAASLRSIHPVDAVAERNAALNLAEAAAKELDNPEAAKAASEAFEKLVSKLDHRPTPATLNEPAKMPVDPDLGLTEEQLAKTSELITRQRQVRERLQAIVGEAIAPQLEALAEASKLGKELADLRDRSRESSPRSQGQAHNASRIVGEELPKAMAQGAEGLAQARPAQARDAQRRAAEIAERGAQAAEDFARSLAGDRPAGMKESQRGQGELADARDAMRQASKNLEANDSSKSPEASMRQAAQGLRSAAAKGQGQKSQGEPGPQTAQQGDGSADGQATDPKGGQPTSAAADLAQLQEAIRRKTGKSWGELPGNLRAELLKQSQSKYRDDYARLIQLYYREIAADAAKP